jgi:hypothetical protein
VRAKPSPATIHGCLISAKRSLPTAAILQSSGASLKIDFGASARSPVIVREKSSDETAKIARLMRVTDAVIEELERQGVTEVVADLGFDPMRMAKAVISAADSDVIPFPGYPGGSH